MSVRSEMNASLDPSGDQAGDRLDFLLLVSWRGGDAALPLASATQISVSNALSSQLVSRTV